MKSQNLIDKSTRIQPRILGYCTPSPCACFPPRRSLCVLKPCSNEWIDHSTSGVNHNRFFCGPFKCSAVTWSWSWSWRWVWVWRWRWRRPQYELSAGSDAAHSAAICQCDVCFAIR